MTIQTTYKCGCVGLRVRVFPFGFYSTKKIKMSSILHKEMDDIHHIEEGDHRYESDNEIAERFNNFFVQSIENLNSEIPFIPFECDIVNSDTLTFSFRAVSLAQIKGHLHDLNGTDEYNNGNKMVLGDNWCGGIEQYVKINEFRPINMLPCFEKLIEKVVFEQLNEFVEKNYIIDGYQSGFRRQHSCETAINKVLYDCNEAMEKSEIIIAVFLDFQRAFETMSLRF